MIPLLKKHYRIDSHQRIAGNNSDFSYEIKLPPDLIGKVDHVSVVGGVFPKSYYLVRDGFNSFTLTEDNKTATVNIPAGNYSLSVFKTTVQTQMNSASPNTFTYSLSFPNSAQTVNDGKWIITVSGNDVIRPIIRFDEISDIREQLGFNHTVNYQFATDNTLKSANVVKFISEDSLFLRSDMVDDYGDDTLLNIYTGGTPDFSTIAYNNPDIYGSAKLMRNKNNGVYRFYLTNEDGESIFLNGVNMVFTIILFKRIDVFEKLSAYLTYRYNTLSGKK
jgi:hypothetical protein